MSAAQQWLINAHLTFYFLVFFHEVEQKVTAVSALAGVLKLSPANKPSVSLSASVLVNG